jgi:multidrug efflux pump subunit AcrA (membrane-fusion protein)
MATDWVRKFHFAYLAFLLGAGVMPPLSTAAELDRNFDCLIGPRVTVKIGAAVSGLLQKVEVDRGDLVKTNQVLARLDSGVEEANLMLARARASNDMQIKGNQARFEFLRRKAERQETLRQKQAVAETTYDESDTDARMAEFAAHEAQLNWEVGQI